MESFAPLLSELETRCRVLRYDQRGQGGAALVDAEYGIAQQVDDLEQVIAAAALPAPYWLLGVAAGCAVAVSYAARHPDQVSGLILCSPALSMSPERAESLRRRAAFAEENGMAAVVDDTLARSWPKEANADAGAAQRFAAYRVHLSNADARSYAAANRALADYAASVDLARLQCPVTLIAGLYDQVRPPSVVSALLQQLPYARYLELPGAHLLPQQAPQALLAEIGVSMNAAPGDADDK